jgi:hypothetical protein
MPIPSTARAARVAALLALAPLGAVGCQSSGGSSPADAQADHQMSQALEAGPHMTLTPMRPATQADSVRAAAVADTLRRAIARYADVRVAEADGFRPFAPNVKRQKVLHYTRYAWAARAAFSFDPAEPTSLRGRWSEMRDGKPVFGPLSPIATREACNAVAGQFRPRVFGWMVHANVLEGDDPAVVWGMSHDGMAHGHGPGS